MKVSYDGIETVATNIEQLTGKIKENLDNIQNSIKKIDNNEYYSGNGATNLMTKFNNVATNFEEMTDELMNCVTYLRSVVVAYKQMDTLATNIGMN